MKNTKTDSKARKVEGSIQNIRVNEQLRYQRIRRRLVSNPKDVMQFFREAVCSRAPNRS